MSKTKMISVLMTSLFVAIFFVSGCQKNETAAPEEASETITTETSVPVENVEPVENIEPAEEVEVEEVEVKTEEPVEPAEESEM